MSIRCQCKATGEVSLDCCAPVEMKGSIAAPSGAATSAHHIVAPTFWADSNVGKLVRTIIARTTYVGGWHELAWR
jgi:hypothetical protein